jgi:UDP-GlcNAc:undecaprenyl-phosphate GlcNAc-1-phosphate transferase
MFAPESSTLRVEVAGPQSPHRNGCRLGLSMHSIFRLGYDAVFVGALIAEFLILAHAQRIGEVLDVMDHPDLVRKRHPKVTPLVGGLAIMVPLLIWSGATFALGGSDNERLQLAILLCGAGATLLGYSDDQSSTSPSSRLLSLFLLTTIALVIEPQLLPVRLNLQDFPAITLEPWMAYCLIAVSMAGFVNAVNMADGQNGIVTGMFVIWSACLTAVTGGLAQHLSQLLFLASVLALLFNMAGKVFLGDSGTYGVTFVFGLLAIKAHNAWGVSAETVAVWFFIPIMDCVRLMISRALNGLAPSDGDTNHFHHRLQDRVGRTGGLIIYLSAVGAPSLVATFVPQLSILCLFVLVVFYVSLAWIDSEQVLKRYDLSPGKNAEKFCVIANNNIALSEALERNADVH